MFFPRLRRQTKWMFVFLAVIFGLGYVIFNVGGSIPGTGLGDVLQGLGQSTSGPTEGDARDKIKDNPGNPTGYFELATALQRNGKTDEAIDPLTRYLAFRPKDRAALSQLAGLYLTQGRQAQDQAALAQAQLTELTGSGVFTPSTQNPFGQQFGRRQDHADRGPEAQPAAEPGIPRLPGRVPERDPDLPAARGGDPQERAGQPAVDLPPARLRRAVREPAPGSDQRVQALPRRRARLSECVRRSRRRSSSSKLL